MFKESLYELKNVRNLCIISILMALQVIVHLTFEIVISQSIHVRFGFLVSMIVGSLFGPSVALIFGFFSDFLCFLVKSTGTFNFGFTISSMMEVFIYALFLYKLKLNVGRVFVSTLVQYIIISFVLNTIWLSYMYYGGDFLKTFMVRFYKCIIVLPINCFLAVFFSSVLKKVSKILKLT